MNINDLTIGEFKELSKLFSGEKRKNIGAHKIGSYVLVRSRNEGLNAGVLADIDETGCVIKEARRLWYHKPAKKSSCWYEGVSLHGLDESSKVSEVVSEKVIIEDFSLTPCEKIAEKSIRGIKSYEN